MNTFQIFPESRYTTKKESSVIESVYNSIDLMPVGLVCQLRYDGGGALLYRDSSEDSVVPFYTTSCRLLMGQKVTFSLQQSAGRAEAVDVACVEECFSTSESKPEPPKHFLQETQLSPVVSSDSMAGTAQLPLSRQLQRSVFRFHNATWEERLVMLGRAEERLETALSSSPLDGAQLCRWVNRWAGWLHAVSLDRRTGGQRGEAGEGRDGGGSWQWRVRKLLIRTLEQLDLADAETFQLLEASLTYIWHLLSKVHLDQLGTTLSRAGKQWYQLQCLLGATQLAQSERTLSPGKIETQLTRDSLPDGQVDRGAGTGVYHPQERVRRLPSVFESERVLLQCPACGTVINSTWRWRHPVNGKVHVLVPHNGHAACTTKVGRRCLWQVLGSMAPKTDHFAHLVFCKHQRREGICKDCGGREMCIHHRQKANCRVCKKLPRERLTKRIQKVVLSWSIK